MIFSIPRVCAGKGTASPHWQISNSKPCYLILSEIISLFSEMQNSLKRVRQWPNKSCEPSLAQHTPLILHRAPKKYICHSAWGVAPQVASLAYQRLRLWPLTVSLSKHPLPIATPPPDVEQSCVFLFLSWIQPSVFCIYRKQLMGENANVPTNDSVW